MPCTFSDVSKTLEEERVKERAATYIVELKGSFLSEGSAYPWNKLVSGASPVMDNREQGLEEATAQSTWGCAKAGRRERSAR
jgi:hypothetical protein